MITELTPEQEAQLEIYAEKWWRIALTTEPANRPEAEKGVNLAYELAGLKPPKEIVWFESPYAMFDSLFTTMYSHFELFRENVGTEIKGEIISGYDLIDDQIKIQIDNSVSNLVFEKLSFKLFNSIYQAIWEHIQISIRNSVHKSTFAYYILGQHSISHAHYQFYQDILGLCQQLDKLAGLRQVAENAGGWIPYENLCFISERHNIVEVDKIGRLHCQNGLAIGYPDGWGVYAWHGVRVPEYVIMQPDKITPKKIMNESNAEVARVMIERYGQDKFIRDGGFTIQQSDDYGDLYRVEFDNGDEPIVAVHVNDASSDRDYFLYVPSHIRSAHEGVAWTFGYDNVSDYDPDRET